MSKQFLAALILFGCAITAAGQTPRIFYSDLQSGPITGGENGKGAFVTIYGEGFGSSQGNSSVKVGGGAVDNYKIWNDKKIAFQLGASSKTGSIVVTTLNGSSNSVPYTVRNGNIYCVSNSGSDSANGTFPGGCWKTLTTARDKIAAGDIVYARNGVVQVAAEDRAYHASLALLGNEGDSGTTSMPKAFIVYPGETATIGSTTTGMYGLRMTEGASYWVIAGWQIRGNTMGIVMGSNSRIVANEMQCPNGDGYFACAISGGSSITFLGNNVYNAGKSGAISKMYHAVYFTTDSNHVEAAWNWIHDSNACRGIQFHSSPVGGTSGQNQYDLSVHDNLIHNVSCDGINFATVDPSKGKVEAYNNVIFNAGTGATIGDAHHSCVNVGGTTNVGTPGKGTVEVYNNTMYNCGANGSYDSGGVAIGGAAANNGLFLRLRNNIMLQSSGMKYLAPNTILSQVSGSNNLWYGNGSAPSQTTANINLDPKFVDLAGRNFQLQASSPALDKGIAVANLLTDKSGITRPQGAGIDLGAYEYFQGNSQPQISCDVNSDGKVDSADVQLTASQILGESGCTEDLNRDGSCSVVDLQRVVNASLGMTCRVGL